jgi:hypothetical protein
VCPCADEKYGFFGEAVSFFLAGGEIGLEEGVEDCFLGGRLFVGICADCFDLTDALLIRMLVILLESYGKALNARFAA